MLRRDERVGRDHGTDRAAVVGMSPPTREYQGHKDLPKRYWVYVYPYWYLWDERAGQ